MKMTTARFGVISLALFLEGCSTGPISEDRMPKLEADQGIAAVVIDSAVGVSQITIVPISGNGKKLFIPSANEGIREIFLFVTPAGRYCMHQFSAGYYFYTAKSDDQCFDVLPGKMSYGGDYVPFTPIYQFTGPARVLTTSEGGMKQSENRDDFLSLLSYSFPNIAANTLTAGEQKTADEIAAAQSTKGLCGVLGSDNAAVLLGVSVRVGLPTAGYASACTFSHSDQQAVHLGVMQGPDVDEKRFDVLTSVDKFSGWIDWTPVVGLGRKASMGKKGNVCELMILLEKSIVALTVEGSQRDDVEAAMVVVARQILSKNIE